MNTTKTNESTAPAETIAAAATKTRKHRRNGSVAHLPKMERDLVNQMLSDGATYRGIVEALEETGHNLRPKNISNWAKGGHLDWLRKEEDRLQIQRRQESLMDRLRKDDAFQLPEAGLQFAATVLSELLTRSGNLEQDLDKYLRATRTLCRLAQELFRLQNYRDECARSLGRDHRPEKIKQETQEFFDTLRDSYGPNPSPDDNEPPPVSGHLIYLKTLLDGLQAKNRPNHPTPPAPDPDYSI